MMKLMTVDGIVLVALALLVGSSHAFTAPSCSFVTPSKKSFSSRSRRTFAVSSTASNSKSDEVLVDEDALWAEQLLSEEVQEVRQEMVQKYISLGRSLESAEVEVDEFLSDRERSQKFLEMRRYAAAQADDLGAGPLLYGGAFFLGLLGTVGMKYFHQMQSMNPN